MIVLNTIFCLCTIILIAKKFNNDNQYLHVYLSQNYNLLLNRILF